MFMMAKGKAKSATVMKVQPVVPEDDDGPTEMGVRGEMIRELLHI